MSETPSDHRLLELLIDIAHTNQGSDPAVELGKIFHSDGLRISGKYFAFIRKGELVVKLPAKRVTELIVRGDAKTFDAGRGRPMKEWVVLGTDPDEALRILIREASEFVASITTPK